MCAEWLETNSESEFIGFKSNKTVAYIKLLGLFDSLDFYGLAVK